MGHHSVQIDGWKLKFGKHAGLGGLTHTDTGPILVYKRLFEENHSYYMNWQKQWISVGIQSEQGRRSQT